MDPPRGLGICRTFYCLARRLREIEALSQVQPAAPSTQKLRVPCSYKLPLPAGWDDYKDLGGREGGGRDVLLHADVRELTVGGLLTNQSFDRTSAPKQKSRT